jgi:hypothetical protein
MFRQEGDAMRHRTRYLVTVLLAVFGGFLMVQGALAEPLPASPAVQADPQRAPEIGGAMSSEELGGLSGQKEVSIDIKDVNAIFSDVDNKGFLGNNSIDIGHKSTFTTGGNSIDGNAFSGMNGIATVIQNSGNQVLIQNATVVDVIVK